MQKAFLAHGQEYVDKLVDETLEQAPEGPTIQEAFPAEGFDCTMPEELPTPTPEQIDQAFEKPLGPLLFRRRVLSRGVVGRRCLPSPFGPLLTG